MPPAALVKKYREYHLARLELATSLPGPRAIELARFIEKFEFEEFPGLEAELRHLMADPDVARELRALLGRG